MSGPLALARQTLADALTAAAESSPDLAGFTVFEYMPEQVTPPCLIISESDQFATTSDEPFGAITVAFDVAVIARGAANATTFPVLEAAVDALIERLHFEHGTNIAAYQIVTTPDGLKYLGARLTLTVSIQL